MSTRDEAWPLGTPSWVDLSSPDVASSNEFYRRLFGWEIMDTGEEMGHYGICMINGRAAAGIGPTQPGAAGPPAWTTYIAVDDAEKTAEAIAANGGTVVMAPMEVPGQGRMAIAADPTGAFFGIWQAQGMIGEGVYNEPGAVSWNEQISRDPDRARQFYSAVFGYTFDPVEGGDPYWTFTTADGRMAGGLGAMPQGGREETPAHWMTYFGVASTDEAASRAGSAGGTVAQPPFTTPFGRIAAIVDPHGAMFMITDNAMSGPDQA